MPIEQQTTLNKSSFLKVYRFKISGDSWEMGVQIEVLPMAGPDPVWRLQAVGTVGAVEFTATQCFSTETHTRNQAVSAFAKKVGELHAKICKRMDDLIIKAALECDYRNAD